MNAAPRHCFLASDGAHSLGKLATEIATTWLSSVDSCTEVYELFDAFGAVLSTSLAQAAKDWNSAHDHMRLLPLELREMCLMSLPAFEKCRLAAVCSSWHAIIAKSQALWASIDIFDGEVDLRSVLSRSGRLPLDLTVTKLAGSSSLMRINAALRPHADRLRSLHLEFSDKSGAYFFQSHEVLQIDFAVPALEELHLRNSSPQGSASRVLELPSDIFNSHAPVLRRVALRGVRLPSGGCPAFAHVTSASIAAHCSGLESLFSIMPSLKRLDLKYLYDSDRRPAIPTHWKLQEAVIHDFFLKYDELDLLGYTRLPRLTVVSQDNMSVVMEAATRISDCSSSTLIIRDSSATELVMHRDDGSVATFAALNLYIADVGAKLAASAALRGVACLVLPLHFNLPERISTKGRTWTCPLLGTAGGMEFPALMTLTILCAPYKTRGCSLIDPAIERGALHAPLLSRIEISAEVWGTEVNVAHLASFVENSLRSDKRSALELFVDVASGVQLDYAGSSDPAAVLNRLRTCVGTLLM